MSLVDGCSVSLALCKISARNNEQRRCCWCVSDVRWKLAQEEGVSRHNFPASSRYFSFLIHPSRRRHRAASVAQAVSLSERAASSSIAWHSLPAIGRRRRIGDPTTTYHVVNQQTTYLDTNDVVPLGISYASNGKEVDSGQNSCTYFRPDNKQTSS